MKILLIGLGSIGRRHLECLQRIGGIDLAALRTAKGTLKDTSSIREFYSQEEAIKFQPDGVIISNPTSLHTDTALTFLKSGSRVLIEKPIAVSLADSGKLKPFADQLRVAYCLRFLPFAAFFREKFRNEKPFKVSFKRSFYLPKWHPYADYKTEYTARKDLGGGVIRTLSHEIDLAQFWLGQAREVVGVVDKLSHLELDVDDFAFFSCKTESGARMNFELDFFSPVNINTGEAFTEKGRYHWDSQSVHFTGYEASTTELLEAVSGNHIARMYQAQMEDFVKFLKTGESVNATYEDATDVLRVIDQVEQASSN